LIVICSPHAKKSDYVNDEIRRFVKSNGPESVLPILLSGIPNNEAKPDQKDEMAFPEALCEVMAMPLATNYVGFDVRKDRVSKGLFEGCWYTVLANILNLSRAEIEQRDKKRQMRRRQLTTAIVSFVMLALTVLAAVAWLQRNEAVKQRLEAKIGQIEALVAASEARLPSNQTFDDLDALVKALQAGFNLRQLDSPTSELRDRVVGTLHKVVYGVRERNRLEGLQGRCIGVGISPDGGRIAGADTNGMIGLWESTGKPLAKYQGPQGWVQSANFNTDLSLLATITGSVGPDGSIGPNSIFTLEVWDLKNQQRVWKTQGPRGWIWQTNFSKDGRYLAAKGKDHVRWWDLSGRPMPRFKRETPRFRMAEVIISSDGKRATAKGDSVEVSGAGHGTIHFNTGHGWIDSWAFNPDGRQLITAGRDGRIRIWDLEANQPYVLNHRGPSRLWGASLCAKRRLLATAGHDGITRLWKFDDVKVTQITEFPGPQGNYVPRVLFSPDGRKLAITRRDRSVGLWDVDSNELLAESRESQGRVVGLSFRSDGSFLLATEREGRVLLWNQKGERLEQSLLTQSWISGITLSPDGHLIATLDEGGTVRLWDWSGNRLAEFRGHPGGVQSVIFRADGQQLATAGTDGIARLWDLNGRQLAQFSGFRNGVMAISFSPDGSLLATAGLDGVATLWNVESKQQVAEFNLGDDGQVFDLQFSANGKRLVSVANDQIARVWPVEGFEELLAKGCNWARGYLANNTHLRQSERRVCDEIGL
jgi:WD40 repeat protein